MCNSCGYNPCTCNSPQYSYNWYNIEGYPCTPCSTNVVCKKIIPARCVYYSGPNLTGIGLATNLNIEVILSSISMELSAQKATADLDRANQAAKNSNILIALNDINSRINVIDSGAHAPYTI